MSKRGNRNKTEDGNLNEIRFPDIVWILPFVMVGAMFGSLAGAGLGLEMLHQTPFVPALFGAILGMLVVSIVGWWLSQVAGPH